MSALPCGAGARVAWLVFASVAQMSCASARAARRSAPQREPTTQGEPAEAPAPAAASAGAQLHGSWALRYRGRFTDDDQDHDLRGVLALDLTDPSAPWIEGHFLARAELDLDGRDEGAVFDGLDDTYDTSLVAKVHAASVDLALGDDPARAPGTLRIGRQDDPTLPEFVRFDGLSFRSRPLGAHEIEIGLFGGIPAHLYESSHAGDSAFGTFVEGRPWRGARARFDWMHLEDEQRLGVARDDLLGLGLWQRVERFGWLEGRFTRLEGANRDLGLRALYGPANSRTSVRLDYYELLETQKALVTELDPFFESLQEHFPYRQAGLDVGHALGEHLALDLGFDLRRVRDPDDLGEFNRDWQRVHATAALHGVPDGLELSLTGDHWNDDQERDEDSLALDLTLTPDPWRLSLGTFYSLYKYDFLELSEREDVRTTYLHARWAASERLRLDLGYELEDDDFDTYHTLRWGAQWRF